MNKKRVIIIITGVVFILVLLSTYYLWDSHSDKKTEVKAWKFSPCVGRISKEFKESLEQMRDSNNKSSVYTPSKNKPQ